MWRVTLLYKVTRRSTIFVCGGLCGSDVDVTTREGVNFCYEPDSGSYDTAHISTPHAVTVTTVAHPVLLVAVAVSGGVAEGSASVSAAALCSYSSDCCKAVLMLLLACASISSKQQSSAQQR
jgi:hypothetical protein